MSIVGLVCGQLPEGLRDACAALGDAGVVAIVHAALVGSARDTRVVEPRLPEPVPETKVAAVPSGGAAGEAYVASILASCVASIRHTSKLPNSGDFMVEHKRRRILVDAKNYAAGRAVPTKEIDKFKRDMRACAGCDGGVVVSLGGGFAGMARGAIAYETVLLDNRIVPLIYLNVAAAISGSRELTCDFMTYAMDMMVMMCDAIDSGDSDARVVALSVSALNVQLDALGTCRIILEESRDALTRGLARVADCETGLREVIRQDRAQAAAPSPQIGAAPGRQS
jgi:hypothetical protein